MLHLRNLLNVWMTLQCIFQWNLNLWSFAQKIRDDASSKLSGAVSDISRAEEEDNSENEEEIGFTETEKRRIMFLTETPRPWLSPFYNKWTYKTLDLNKYLKNTKCKLTVFCRLWSKTSEYCLFHCQWSYFYHFFPLSCKQTMMSNTMDTVQVWKYWTVSSSTVKFRRGMFWCFWLQAWFFDILY